MKLFLVAILCYLFGQAYASSLYQRYSNAIDQCIQNNRILSNGEIRQIPNADLAHYQKSKIQTVLSPAFIGIFDHFGSVVQGAIVGGDEARVKPYLKNLATEAKKLSLRKNLTARQQICIAGCITNQLMEADPDVNPFTSLDLAVASGEGFCRHFTGATKYLLDKMSITNNSETALDHTYTIFYDRGIKLIFDATISDGKYDCFFYEAP